MAGCPSRRPPRRTCTARAPCPGAHGQVLRSSRKPRIAAAEASSSPFRASRTIPASAASRASIAPLWSHSSRRPTEPRTAQQTRSGRRARAPACRLGDDVPSRAPAVRTANASFAAAARVAPTSPSPSSISASGEARVAFTPGASSSRSNGRSRSGTAAITSPGSSSTGRSFSEWTTRSTVPSRSAALSSPVNTPLD